MYKKYDEKSVCICVYVWRKKKTKKNNNNSIRWAVTIVELFPFYLPHIAVATM